MNKDDADLTSPESRTRAWALMKRGILRVDSGDHDAAMADFLEAERVAEQAGLDDLVSVSRINQGHAYSVKGDPERAIRLFEQAADLTRAAGDTKRLRLSLANLSVVLKQQGRHADAIAALTEYLEFLDNQDAAARGEAYVDRAASHIELADYEQAAADLAEADDAATETDDRSLRYSVRMNRANIYLHIGDLEAARIVLEQALDLARATGDSFQLQDTLIGLAQVCRRTGLRQQADRLFTEVEREYRQHGNAPALADSLYWHGTLRRSLGLVESAVALWKEEEAIRRESGQEGGHLAECLSAQAHALRALNDHDAADPLFREAAELLDKLNRTENLPGLLYSHGMSLRAAGKSAEALERADEALRLATPHGDSAIERRARSLRAMALADLGQIAAAKEALDAAVSSCEKAEAHSAMVWTLARRAYVAARDGDEPQDVVEYLRSAHQYALTYRELTASRSAVRRIEAETSLHCSDAYAEPIRAFRLEQLEEINNALKSEMPPDMMAPPVDPALSAVAPLEDDDLDSSSEEE